MANATQAVLDLIPVAVATKVATGVLGDLSKSRKKAKKRDDLFFN